MRKGIILAGGTGSRLFPLTCSVSKQLMAVYDKPMIYYPLSTLMLAGIRDILIITMPQDQALFQHLLKDGSQWGIRLSYAVQPRPEGLAQAFLIAKDFIGNDPVALILGDNIFHGDGLSGMLRRVAKADSGATVFGYTVKHPERYGVVEFDDQNRVLSIEEKPTVPKSKVAITGLYFFDARVVEMAGMVTPSARGELEITDVIRQYLELDALEVVEFGRGMAWLDTGTHDSLLDAGNFIQMVEARQGLKIACLEEIAFTQGWISARDVTSAVQSMPQNGYGDYLLALVEGAR